MFVFYFQGEKGEQGDDGMQGFDVRFLFISQKNIFIKHNKPSACFC